MNDPTTLDLAHLMQSDYRTQARQARQAAEAQATTETPAMPFIARVRDGMARLLISLATCLAPGDLSLPRRARTASR